MTLGIFTGAGISGAQPSGLPMGYAVDAAGGPEVAHSAAASFAGDTVRGPGRPTAAASTSCTSARSADVSAIHFPAPSRSLSAPSLGNAPKPRGRATDASAHTKPQGSFALTESRRGARVLEVIRTYVRSREVA